MLSILKKVDSRVICCIDNQRYEYKDGISAYQAINHKYMISSLSAQDNDIILVLEEISDDEHWKKQHQKQFGHEPSFF